MSLLDSLPAPERKYASTRPVKASKELAVQRSTFEPPPYGSRRGFVPRRPEDFGDGARPGRGGKGKGARAP